jgi:hypothetical protein
VNAIGFFVYNNVSDANVKAEMEVGSKEHRAKSIVPSVKSRWQMTPGDLIH